MNKGIIGVAGIACQAFKLFDSICQEYGNLTLGELARMLSSGCFVFWRVEE